MEQTVQETEADQSTEPSIPLIYFHQDGSCDSVKVQLSSKNLNNLNKSIVELIGFTGTIRHNIIELQTNDLNSTNSNETVDKISQTSQSASNP